MTEKPPVKKCGECSLFARFFKSANEGICRFRKHRGRPIVKANDECCIPHTQHRLLDERRMRAGEVPL